MRIILTRIRAFTHVYLCSKRELYREMNAARAYAKRIEHRLESAQKQMMQYRDIGNVHFANWQREVRENQSLKDEISSLRHRVGGRSIPQTMKAI